METTYPVRLYVNPVKQLLLLVICVIFVVIGYFMRQDPTRGSIGYFVLILFGLGGLMFLYQLVQAIILRQPVLEITPSGWRSRPSPFTRATLVSWGDISQIVIFRQRGRPGHNMFYLVALARDPNQLPPGRLRALNAALNAAMFPKLRAAALTIPLNSSYVRTTPKQCDELLRRIHATCGRELYQYQVGIIPTIQDL